MPLPDLPASLAASRGQPAVALAAARQATAPLGGDGGPYKTFISVAETPSLAEKRTSDALLGCLFSVKDNIDEAGFATTCGSRVLENEAPVERDAAVVAALKAAGAISLGKNNMHEFALGITGANERYGHTASPWDDTRNVGGSSGGSASAVALRQVHLALGTDSGGSVRMPASFTGIAGFKPTFGSISLAGVAGAAWSIDSVGFFTATAADQLTVWQALHPDQGTSARSRRLTLAYLCDSSMGRVEPVVWQHYTESIESLRKAGVSLTPVSLGGFELAPYLCIATVYPEVTSAHHELLRQRAALYDQAIRGLICLGEAWSERVYLDAQRLRSVLRDRFAAILSPFDAVLTPTVPLQPPKRGVPAHVVGDPDGGGLFTAIRFTVVSNVTGYPAISVPSGLDADGLPVGIQMVGRPHEDAALLDAAAEVEAILGPTPAPPGAA